MLNQILYLIMILSFISYVGWIWIIKGIQKSISHSYLLLTRKEKVLFTLFAWGTASPALILANLDGFNPLMSIAGAGLVFVGAAANISEKLTQKVHQVAAYTMVGAAFLALIFHYQNYYVAGGWFFLSLMALLTFSDDDTQVWWIEIMTFIAIGIVLWNF